ncbi:MAG: DnaJ domain-containing protein [Candidatus Doudnabacteria bacterium]|nr:DnaJ domain-containing protein [Candidatus Doudnabacteria bacterium]
MPREKGFGGGEEYNRKRSYYEVLRVSPAATNDEIRLAFRKLARETHPDIPANKGKEELFKDVNEAYQVLSDPKKRRTYDLGFSASGAETPPRQDTHRTQQPPRQEQSHKRPKSDFGSDFGFDEDFFKDTGFGKGFDFYEELKKARARTGYQQRHTGSEEFKRKKDALDEVSRQLKQELEDLFKDPIRNKAKIDNFSEYAKRRMDEATGGTSSSSRAFSSSFRESTTHQEPQSSESYSARREEQSPQQGHFTIRRTGSFVSLVDERGSSVGSSYKDIQQYGRYYVGTGIVGYQRLIDGNTGRELSSSYKKIDIIGDFVIATDISGYQRLLDTNTGRDLSRSYKQINIMGNLPVANEMAGYQRLLDRNTGQELSSSYKSLILRDDLLIGQDIAGYEHLIDKRTGRELSSSMYKLIERRGGKIIGHRVYGEEEIKVNDY